ncbi:MAG: myo-inositol-1(or 4)-monophosphatase [Hyphomicrobiaceae bacterium]|jgi:myo-inositol-1(or 4)-monophosphatase
MSSTTSASGAASDAAFVAKLARSTGDLLLGYFHKKNLNGHLKKDFSLVTDADVAADQSIHDALAVAYPDDAVISEELAPTAGNGSSAVWVVDPLDGTTNFSLGLPHWGVSIARLVYGRPVVAALYFPLLDELFTASCGEGAFLNGEPTRVATPAENHGLGFLACCSRTHLRYHVALPLKTRILGSAAYSLCAVAKGSAAAALETTPRLWDIAAAWLVVEEAGGVVAPFEGEGAFPLVTGQGYSDRPFATMAASSVDLARDMRDSITPR